jgi:hypothetical protein
VKENSTKVLNLFSAAIKALPERTTCDCAHYLERALKAR